MVNILKFFSNKQGFICNLLFNRLTRNVPVRASTGDRWEMSSRGGDNESNRVGETQDALT